MDTAVTPRWADRDILIPNELEQRQIFYMMKKGSSWTRWNRALGYYRKWAEIAENSVREADNSGLLAIPEKCYITYQRYVKILQGLAVYEEGVRRLRKGDRRVFLDSEAYAFFERAWLTVDYWQTFRDKVNIGDIRGGDDTPYWDGFIKALNDLCNAGEMGGFSLDAPNEPANLRYYLWHAVFLSRLPYPDPLPDLPERPKKDVIIATGEPVPFSGIWEPLDKDEDQLWGVMNYLHGETKAPTYRESFIDHSNEITGYGDDIIPVRWRLLWRDDRYLDGTIPEEEKDYIFVCPEPEGQERMFNADPLKYLKRHNLPNPFLVGACHRRGERVEGGEPCPRDGYWWSPANKSQGRIFRKGEIMPIITSREYAESYWLWGGETEKK
ncbi:MAG: immunity 71 family protein [Azoarcus sp.]|jgi:hypothetical protein|nr:immunity 71 family protein [Azoarcus sp.]